MNDSDILTFWTVDLRKCKWLAFSSPDITQHSLTGLSITDNSIPLETFRVNNKIEKSPSKMYNELNRDYFAYDSDAVFNTSYNPTTKLNVNMDNIWIKLSIDVNIDRLPSVYKIFNKMLNLISPNSMVHISGNNKNIIVYSPFIHIAYNDYDTIMKPIFLELAIRPNINNNVIDLTQICKNKNNIFLGHVEPSNNNLISYISNVNVKPDIRLTKIYEFVNLQKTNALKAIIIPKSHQSFSKHEAITFITM